MSNINGSSVGKTVGILNRMGRNLPQAHLDEFDREAMRQDNAIRRIRNIAPRRQGQTRSGFGKACNHANASPVGHIW